MITFKKRRQEMSVREKDENFNLAIISGIRKNEKQEKLFHIFQFFVLSILVVFFPVSLHASQTNLLCQKFAFHNNFTTNFSTAAAGLPFNDFISGCLSEKL